MLFALTGPQGGGKSTIVEHFQTLGFPIILRKTARSILGEWGMTLHQVNNDFNLSLKFQEEVIKRKHEDEMEALNDKEKIWFVERSFVDVFAYTLVNFGKNNEFNTWLNNYHDRCKEYQQYYDGVIYVQGGLFPIRDDGVRGINQHYGKMIDLIMQNYVEEMTDHRKLLYVTTSDHETRIQQITDFANHILS